MAYTSNPSTYGKKPPCYGPHGGVGDIMGDGRVAADDLAMMTDASVGDITLSPREASRADLDGNGRPADAVDVAILTDYLVGDITTFPVCSKPGYTTTPPSGGREPPCYGPHGGMGDIGGDGRVDASDKELMIGASVGNIMLSPREASRADLDGNGRPAGAEDVAIITDYIVGSINTFPVCGVTPTPPPPNMETRTVSLTEGQHTIQVSFAGYDTLNATINVSSTGVTCVSVIGGACGGSSLPRVSTSGWTVTTYLKSGAVTTNRCTWIATKDTSKVVFISDMVLAYNNLKNIGFTPSASEIGDAVLMYSNLGTPASLWGC
jgi:hypothetical protein